MVFIKQNLPGESISAHFILSWCEVIGVEWASLAILGYFEVRAQLSFQCLLRPISSKSQFDLN